MSPENIHSYSVPEDRIGKVRDWGEMSSFLSFDNDEERKKTMRFLRGYFKAQLFLQSGNRVKAKTVFEALDKASGYKSFEDSNQDLLKTIDLAVRGESRW